MYNRWTTQKELTPEQMRLVRKGFRRLLARGRYRPEFIVNNCDEILGMAYVEYVRAVEKGIEIEDPVAWTIYCAHMRTKTFLEAKSVRPQEVSSEKVLELSDETTPSPALLAEEADRQRKIREAVAKLDADQRKLLALTYFGELSVREAGRQLKWGTSRAQRCHQAAIRTLRRSLPVRSSDELEIIVGLTAWLSFQSGASFHFPAGLEAVLDKTGHQVDSAWGRIQDLARRISMTGGGEAAGVAASSGAGRGWGTTCAAAVGIVCSLGVGAGAVVVGVDGGTSHPAPPTTAARHQVAQVRHSSSPTSNVEARSEASPLGTASASSPSAAERRVQRKAARATTDKREAEQVKAQTSGIARAASESSATESEASAASSEPAASETVTVTPSSGSPASPEEKAQAKQQFGAFK
jgi:RNA polymerase sigma factor (sigma-70 family)